MSAIPFWKYHGAGNDFIMIDQRSNTYLTTGDQERIEHLCHRRFGIGADGLIILEHAERADFRMLYFNADGRLGSLCGNGGRCAVAFAHDLGIIGEQCRFLAFDGPHEARLPHAEWVELQMHDIREMERRAEDFCLDTGSPHFVRFISRIDGFPVVEEGRRIRYSEPFKEKGINVNFVEPTHEGLQVATYERGVEDETLACGTGVTASAMAYVATLPQPEGNWDIPIQAKGGKLRVRFRYDGSTFSDVWLCGPAQRVFSGEVYL